jgi:putative addiction module killer protein
MQVKERRIIMLQLSNGKIPFESWYERLDQISQRAVDARLTRIAVGNFGDHKSVGAGVFELRIPTGPGLRVYYGLKSNELVVLLGGGDKGSQRKDIDKAKELWRKSSNER